MTVLVAGKPDKLIPQCKFTLVLSPLQFFPRPVDVGEHLAFTWSIRLLIVCPHLALNGEQQHLKIALLHKPAFNISSMPPVKYPPTTKCS